MFHEEIILVGNVFNHFVLINTERGAKCFIQPETINSVFFPLARECSVRCRVEGVSYAALRWRRHTRVLSLSNGSDLSKASLLLKPPRCIYCASEALSTWCFAVLQFNYSGQ